ncbi:anti-sigma-K factor RskA [Gordonia namibiensis NBRC 108229]|uniref:Regulator of SigK n=1 Tax=Gordonia namibiensis NBRC 108229 TaxID=1208314 RepID=K6X904_9ACTN|nr:anti-sigma factor [Gordonia namibiensis]GAC00843.1 anti-sigma-K factor RskA [Gordonia namibiensis NBRC 108229]
MPDLAMTTTDAEPDDRMSAWLDDHIELYAVSALTPEETLRAERELAALPPDVRSAYEARIVEIHTTMAGFASTYALEAPSDLRRRVLTHVFDEAAETDGPEPSTTPQPVPIGGRRQSPRRKAAVLAAAAATVAVALGAGVLIGRTTAPEPSPAAIAVGETQQEVLTVLAAGDATVTAESLADDHGTITVITSATAGRAVTLIRDVGSPLSPDSTFQLWLVGGSENPIPAGLIPGGDTEPVVVDDLGDSQVLAVTIEPAGGSPQPTTPILAQVPL